MSDSELPKTYNPADHEENLYKMWEESGTFAPDQSTVDRPPAGEAGRPSTVFSTIMPPPNANGALHIGHAVGVTIQDLLTRYHRMKGDATLWLPGADHAGFETQVVFEKQLEKKGQSRFDFDRETLYKMMLDFSLGNKVHMENQLRRLGASCDWSREKFTLDPEIVKIVYETFQQLYQAGLVYRAEGIVNWCPKHQTSLSGLEVKYIEHTDPMYYIRYPLAQNQKSKINPFDKLRIDAEQGRSIKNQNDNAKLKIKKYLVVATVRPETIFGDLALAVHPQDERYGRYIDAAVVVPIDGRQITVITDDSVDPEFGTGVVKITPSHDRNDFAIAKRHQLSSRQVIDFDGRMNELARALRGMNVKQARARVVEELGANRLIEKIDNHYTHSVAVCYKCNTPIEPQVKMQWWLKMTENSKFEIRNSKIKEQLGKSYSLRDVGVAAVKSGEVKFITKKFEKIFLHWMKVLEDWNLSRQIVWGIQLPVWYCRDCDHTVVDVPKEVIVYAVRHGQAEHNVKGILNGDPHRASNLTKQGRQEVERLAEQLKGVKFDHIFVSAMPRTRQTAEIIQTVIARSEMTKQSSRDRHVPRRRRGHRDDMKTVAITVDQRLNDIWVGELEGRLIDHVRQKTHDYTKSIGGSETLADITLRSQSFFNELIGKYAGQTVLVVSSEILLHCLYESPSSACEETGLDHPGTGSYRRLVFHYPNKCPKCNGQLQRDPDVFDTWFSSGQWTFAPLVANDMNQMSAAIMAQKNVILDRKRSTPDRESDVRFREHDKASDFEKFYPTTVMETGWDILFFWVARMIMLGLYKTGQVPFKYVYLHGLVRDKDRQKMSKSKGNVIDPLGVAEMYGADAVRMALVFGTSAGNDMAISEEKIRGMRNFANKVWNIGRFVLTNLPNLKHEARNTKQYQNTKSQNSKRLEFVSDFGFRISDLKEMTTLTNADKKMLIGLRKTVKIVTTHIEKFRFHQAAGVLYDFIWHEYADQYLEAAKKQLDDPKLKDSTAQLLVISFQFLVKLLHPFQPFVTEAIWQEMVQRRIVSEQLLITARWPETEIS